MSLKMLPRQEAIIILQQIIIERRSLASRKFAHPLAQEICYGTLRWYFRLKALLIKLLHSPTKKLEIKIELLLLSGLYQLIYLNEPHYAVVDETVTLAKKLHKTWAVKLTNAVLRQFLRQQSELLEEIDTQPWIKHSHPQWLYQMLKSAWPTAVDNILAANNQRPPFSLRINLLREQRNAYLPGELHPYNNAGIILNQAQNIETLHGFNEGKVSIQDNAAQLAAELLLLAPGQIVLDACAAPGGKTAHIMETEPRLKKLIALDVDIQRLERIAQNLQRLNLTATLIRGDATSPEQWWDGQLFDRILLDAPCSATGVIRRHPDIKILRLEKDIAAVVALQRQLLNKLWPLLKPGGILVYATCSILPAENIHNIAIFLQQHIDAKENVIHETWGISQPFGRQILPGMDNMDGFYYCRLEKISNACASHAV